MQLVRSNLCESSFGSLTHILFTYSKEANEVYYDLDSIRIYVPWTNIPIGLLYSCKHDQNGRPNTST